MEGRGQERRLESSLERQRSGRESLGSRTRGWGLKSVTSLGLSFLNGEIVHSGSYLLGFPGVNTCKAPAQCQGRRNHSTDGGHCYHCLFFDGGLQKESEL